MIADRDLKKGLLNLKITWFTMLISLVIYLVLGLYAGANLGPTMKGDVFGKVKAVFYIVSLITLIAARYLRRVLLSRKSQYQQSSLTAQHTALQTYCAATIVALGMSEAIGVYGLILFLLGKNPLDLYLLILISAGAIFMYRPRRDEVNKLAGDGQYDLSTGGATS